MAQRPPHSVRKWAKHMNMVGSPGPGPLGPPKPALTVPAQVFVSISAELSHNHSHWVLDSDKGVSYVVSVSPGPN